MALCMAYKMVEGMLKFNLQIAGDDGEITATHLLLGIWSEVESPGHKIMAALGFNDAKANTLTSLSSDPEFVDG